MMYGPATAACACGDAVAWASGADLCLCVPSTRLFRSLSLRSGSHGVSSCATCLKVLEHDRGFILCVGYCGLAEFVAVTDAYSLRYLGAAPLKGYLLDFATVADCRRSTLVALCAFGNVHSIDNILERMDSLTHSHNFVASTVQSTQCADGIFFSGCLYKVSPKRLLCFLGCSGPQIHILELTVATGVILALESRHITTISVPIGPVFALCPQRLPPSARSMSIDDSLFVEPTIDEDHEIALGVGAYKTGLLLQLRYCMPREDTAAQKATSLTCAVGELLMGEGLQIHLDVSRVFALLFSLSNDNNSVSIRMAFGSENGLVTEYSLSSATLQSSSANGSMPPSSMRPSFKPPQDLYSQRSPLACMHYMFHQSIVTKLIPWGDSSIISCGSDGAVCLYASMLQESEGMARRLSLEAPYPQTAITNFIALSDGAFLAFTIGNVYLYQGMLFPKKLCSYRGKARCVSLYRGPSNTLCGFGADAGMLIILVLSSCSSNQGATDSYTLTADVVSTSLPPVPSSHGNGVSHAIVHTNIASVNGSVIILCNAGGLYIYVFELMLNAETGRFSVLLRCTFDYVSCLSSEHSGGALANTAASARSVIKEQPRKHRQRIQFFTLFNIDELVTREFVHTSLLIARSAILAVGNVLHLFIATRANLILTFRSPSTDPYSFAYCGCFQAFSSKNDNVVSIVALRSRDPELSECKCLNRAPNDSTSYHIDVAISATQTVVTSLAFDSNKTGPSCLRLIDYLVVPTSFTSNTKLCYFPDPSSEHSDSDEHYMLFRTYYNNCVTIDALRLSSVKLYSYALDLSYLQSSSPSRIDTPAHLNSAWCDLIVQSSHTPKISASMDAPSCQEPFICELALVSATRILATSDVVGNPASENSSPGAIQVVSLPIVIALQHISTPWGDGTDINASCAQQSCDTATPSECHFHGTEGRNIFWACPQRVRGVSTSFLFHAATPVKSLCASRNRMLYVGASGSFLYALAMSPRRRLTGTGTPLSVEHIQASDAVDLRYMALCVESVLCNEERCDIVFAGDSMGFLSCYIVCVERSFRPTLLWKLMVDTVPTALSLVPLSDRSEPSVCYGALLSGTRSSEIIATDLSRWFLQDTFAPLPAALPPVEQQAEAEASAAGRSIVGRLEHSRFGSSVCSFMFSDPEFVLSVTELGFALLWPSPLTPRSSNLGADAAPSEQSVLGHVLLSLAGVCCASYDGSTSLLFSFGWGRTLMIDRLAIGTSSTGEPCLVRRRLQERLLAVHHPHSLLVSSSCNRSWAYTIVVAGSGVQVERFTWTSEKEHLSLYR